MKLRRRRQSKADLSMLICRVSFPPHSTVLTGTNLSTCHYHVCCYNTTVIFHPSLGLPAPLTLTWTLMSKTEAAIRHVACGYWNVCTHRFLTWGDHHAVLSTVHAYTQQNHIVWITKHSSSYYESKVYLNDFNMLILLPFPVFVCLYSPIIHFYTHRYVQHFSSAYVCDILCIWQVNY